MICVLPGGYIDPDGRLQRDAELLPLTGREEELLAEHGRAPGAALVTAILSRCVARIGTIAPVGEATARRLLVADRQYLLLKLRELTFGTQVRSSITCPWPDCRKRIDVSFSTGDIPVRESVDKGPLYGCMLSEAAAPRIETGETYCEVRFRLPNGADQEALAEVVSQNEARALTLLLQRCITAIGPIDNPDARMVEALSPRARLEIEQAMAAAAPQIDLAMESVCPECRREYDLPFDLQGFFFGELHVNRDLLYREVHYLAYHYHWSEGEIMGFSREKRRRYIDLLADEIERMNDER